MAYDHCDLSNEELIEKCNDWVSRLAKSGGKDWRLSVPVSFNYDPDMLFCELANRFKKSLESTPSEETIREDAERECLIDPFSVWYAAMSVHLPDPEKEYHEYVRRMKETQYVHIKAAMKYSSKL